MKSSAVGTFGGCVSAFSACKAAARDNFGPVVLSRLWDFVQLWTQFGHVEVLQSDVGPMGESSAKCVQGDLYEKLCTVSYAAETYTLLYICILILYGGYNNCDAGHPFLWVC